MTFHRRTVQILVAWLVLTAASCDRVKERKSQQKSSAAEAARRRELPASISQQIGRPAPDITGEDSDGNTFKLSDYKGKVVLLDFWATWCHYCRLMFPEERSLVKHFQGKQFVLLGVNNDAERKALKEAENSGEVAWRSWWDGDSRSGGGRIASAWRLQGWPTVYLLDQEGVVRNAWIGPPEEGELRKEIDELLSRISRNS